MRIIRPIIILISFLLLASLAGAALAQTETPADVTWQASYWNDITPDGDPVLQRTEPALDHNWGQGSPDPAISPDRFSARWTTEVTLEEGNYRFTTVSDDGVRVWVDGIRIIDNWTTHAPETNATTLPLEAGAHEITVEYFENTGEALISLDWQSVGDPGDENVTISPTQGPPGTELTVMAQGFPANTEVTVGIGRAQSEPTTSKMVMTDAAGTLQTTITLPPTAEAGEPWVVLVANFETAEKALSQTFNVTGEAGVTCGPQYVVQPGDWLYRIARRCNVSVEALLAANPQITDPSIIEVGELLTIPGGQEMPEQPEPPAPETDVTATTTVNLRLRDLPTTDSEQLDVIPAGTTVPVLAQNATGDWLQVTYDGQTGWVAGWYTTTSGDVAELPNLTYIYLIALEDAGQMGEEIGCQDSVVPVSAQVEPTPAPLTAALEQLLAIDEQFYGQTGLYNALADSDLSVESVNITEGVATIRLTGTLQLGGVCDNPRVEAQLEHTALRYSTVDEVSIFVNGQPLEQLLSGQ